MKQGKEPLELKDYPTSWRSAVILACRRCQRRLRKQHNPPPFAKLKKWVKKRAGKAPKQATLHVIDVPCLKICPKSAIVVINQAQFASRPAHFSIISDTDQMEHFYQDAQMPLS